MSPKFLFTLLGIFALLIYSGSDSVQDAIGFVPALYAAGLMSLMGGVGGRISLLFKKSDLVIRSLSWWVIAVYCAYFGSIELLLYLCVKMAGPVQTVLFTSLSVPLVVIFGGVFLKHKLNYKYYCGGLLSFFGVVLCVLTHHNNVNIGLSGVSVILLVFTVLMLVAYVCTSNLFNFDSRPLIAAGYLVGSFILLSLAYFFETWHPLTLKLWLIIILGGLCMNFVADVSWDFSLKRGNFYLLNSSGNFLPLVAIALMVWLGQTKFSWYLVLAAALVVAGCALPEIGKQENAKGE